jgi:hypothetical protein
MKNLILIIGLLLSSSAFANEPVTEGVRISPCSYWRYYTEVNGYVCTSTGMSMTIPDEYEVRQLQRTIRDMESRIAALETALKRLESN